MRKLLTILLSFVFALVLALPVLAAGTYSSEITIKDTSGGGRLYLSALVPANITSMVSSGQLGSTGMDSRFFEGTSEQKYMLADDKIGVFIPVLGANQTRTYRFETGYSPPNTSLPIVLGTGSYITTADDPLLEPADSFEIEVSGYFNTLGGANRYILNKAGAITIDLSTASTLRSIVYAEGTGYALGSAVIDGNYLYIGDDQGAIYKVNLTSYLIEDYLMTDGTGCEIWGMVVSGNYLYAVRRDNPTRITKVSLTSFTVSSDLTLAVGEINGDDIVISGSYAYIANNYDDSITKVDLATFTRVGQLTHADIVNPVDLVVVGANLYVACDSTNQHLVKIDLGAFTYTATLHTAVSFLKSLASDGTYLYVGQNSSPGKIVRVDIGAFTVVDTLTLGANENRVVSLMHLGTDLYAGLNTASGEEDPPTILVKIDETTFTETSHLHAPITGSHSNFMLANDGTYVYVPDYSDPYYTYKVEISSFTIVDDLEDMVYPVTLSGIMTTGDRIVKLTYDGADLELYVGAALLASEAIVLTVYDTNSDWLWCQNNVSPYQNYIKLSVDNPLALTVHYQPEDIISGVVLPDLEGAAQDGVIFWGSNSNLTIAMGGLSSVISLVPGGEDLPVVVPAPTVTGYYEPTATITSMPYYDLVLPAATGLEWSTNHLYGILAIFVGIALGVGVLIATSSALLASAAVGIGLSMGAGAGVLGWWVILVYALLVSSYLVVTRSM